MEKSLSAGQYWKTGRCVKKFTMRRGAKFIRWHQNRGRSIRHSQGQLVSIWGWLQTYIILLPRFTAHEQGGHGRRATGFSFPAAQKVTSMPCSRHRADEAG